MADKDGRLVVALEEHYWDPAVSEHFGGGRATALQERLYDLGELRLREMDESGIDIQVLSHGAPALQRVNPEAAVDLAVKANDRLCDSVAVNPSRFAAFAMLPIPEPAACADELERCVDKLGFKGAMVHGLTGEGLFLDDKRFWPIYERAQALDVPIYLHPAPVHDAVLKAYYADYTGDFPNLATSAWGWTVETATMAIRMVLSGVFDAYPNLKVIVGHMGESIPFSLVRIDESLSRAGNKALTFRKTFADHFWITTSGNFSTPALLCSVMEMGADRVMFSIDYPFVPNPPGPKWFETVPLGDEDKAKILGGNAKRLLKL